MSPEYPSASLLSELDQWRDAADSPDREREIWRILTRAARNADFPILLDYAYDHGLATPCETPKRGQGRAPSWTHPIDGSTLIWIGPGRFLVGSDDRLAESEGFALARFPITNAQFQTFLNETAYQPPLRHPDNALFLKHWGPHRVLPEALQDHPVVWVSFFDALAYCSWAGLALPTEWLWEKAARGPEGRRYPWGDHTPFGPYVWAGGPTYPLPLARIQRTGTCAVGEFAKSRSPYGCEDLIGNVSEWCWLDEAAIPDFGRFPEPNPQVVVPHSHQMGYEAVRGSCFLRMSTQLMASSHRRRLSNTRRNQWTGFRPSLFLPCRPVVRDS